MQFPSQVFISVILCISTHSCQTEGMGDEFDFELKMPNVSLSGNQVVICVSHEILLEDGYHYYIVKVDPHLNPVVKHHFSLWACKPPGNKTVTPSSLPSLYECPNPGAPRQHQLPYMHNCRGGYGHQWFIVNKRDQGSVTYPEGSGIRIGPGTDFESIVLASHFVDVMQVSNGWTGESGVTLTIKKVLKSEDDMKQVGIMATYIRGWIPAHSNAIILAEVPIDEDVTLTPISIVFHAHTPVRAVVSRVSPSGKDLVLYDDDPKSGVYRPVTAENATIKMGDTIRTVCFYDNRAGNTTITVEVHEMCIMGLAYVAEGPLFSVTKTFNSPVGFHQYRPDHRESDDSHMRYYFHKY